MIVAAIDIGTNSIRCLVEDIEGDNRRTLFREARITRLGESLASEMELKDEAMERALKAIRDYYESIELLSAQKVRVVATSAVRDASNQDVFLSKVSECCHYDVEILTGLEEAELSFKGATHDNPEAFVENRSTVVIDIGGGSTEVIVGTKDQILHSESMDVGCVRLFELFLHSDPPTLSELKALRDYLWQKTRDVSARVNPFYPARAIGLAGTLTTLGAIKQQLKVYKPEKIHGSYLSRSEVNAIHERLLKMPISTRKRVIGLQPERADTIISGTIILLDLMKGMRLMEIMISEHDIMDGIVLTLAES